MLFQPRPKGLGKDNFLKINDGQEVTGVFRGEVRTYKTHWQGEGKPSAECIGADCPICKADPEKNRPAFRFRINFIDLGRVDEKAGNFTAKVFEGGGRTYDDLVSLNKKFPLESTVIEIGRTGQKKDTRYRFLPMTNHPVTKELDAKLKSVKLVPLNGEVTE